MSAGRQAAGQSSMAAIAAAPDGPVSPGQRMAGLGGHHVRMAVCRGSLSAKAWGRAAASKCGSTCGGGHLSAERQPSARPASHTKAAASTGCGRGHPRPRPPPIITSHHATHRAKPHLPASLPSFRFLLSSPPPAGRRHLPDCQQRGQHREVWPQRRVHPPRLRRALEQGGEQGGARRRAAQRHAPQRHLPNSLSCSLSSCFRPAVTRCAFRCTPAAPPHSPPASSPLPPPPAPPAPQFMCPCHGSQYNAEGKKVRGPAPLSLALVHCDITDDIVTFSTW